MIEVFDNFLPNEYFEELQSKILGFSQPWYYLNNITFPESLETIGHSAFVMCKKLENQNPTTEIIPR